jgi:hypothetical protein
LHLQTAEIDGGGHYTSCGSKNSKLNNEKQGSDENGASKGTTRYDPESEDTCYSTEKKSTHYEENAYSSFPGSPRNKNAREIFTSLVPEDYDYSRSTEYAHSVHTAAASAAADKNTYESRVLGNGDSCTMSSAAKDKQVPLQQDHFQVMPISAAPDTKPKNGVLPQSPTAVASVTPLYVGKYAKQRKELDHSYHSHYTPERQYFHDMLIGTCIVRALHEEIIKTKIQTLNAVTEMFNLILNPPFFFFLLFDFIIIFENYAVHFLLFFSSVLPQPKYSALLISYSLF